MSTTGQQWVNLPSPGPGRRPAIRAAVSGIAAAACLAVAVATSMTVRIEMTGKPTAAELTAAASTAAAQRWERTPAGAIFPASIGYSTDLLTQETAARLGISPAT